MFDIALRRWKDGLADPWAKLVPASISPDHITLAAGICGLLSCLTASRPGYMYSTLIFWGLNRFLDCLDGSVARLRNKSSALGGFYDLLSDFVVYSLLPIAVSLGAEASGTKFVNWPLIAFLEATFHVNNFILFYSAAIASQRDDRELTTVTMRPALIEGFESGLLFTAMLIWPKWINLLALSMSVGVVVGILQRTVEVSAVLAKDRTKT